MQNESLLLKICRNLPNTAHPRSSHLVRFTLLLFFFFGVTVVNQFYKAEILTEYVIRGNTAVLKCSIPSFVADFVHVEAWIDDEGKILTASENYGKKITRLPLPLEILHFLLVSLFI